MKDYKIKEEGYEFITKQGLKANIIIEESIRKDGELLVRKLDLDGQNIYTAQIGNYGNVELTYAADRNRNYIKLFALKIEKDACKNFLKVSNIKSRVKSAYVQIDNKELENLYNELPKARDKEKQEEADRYFEECKKDNTKLTFWLCGNAFCATSKINESNQFKNMKYAVGKYVFSEDLLDYLTETDWGDYTITTYYEMTINELLEVYNKANNRKIESDKKEKEKEEKERKEREAIFEKARVTGEKQVLSKILCDCNDPYEECNLDIIYLYALPNGETEEVRTHTW